MTPPVLSISNLFKTFPGSRLPAVNDFSLEVEKGQIISLLGESGCGKTTVLRMLAGFEVPDSGNIVLNGKQVSSKSVFIEPEHRGVGFVFQDYALFPHKTVEENISFGLFKQNKIEKRQRTSQIIDLCGLQGLEKRYPHQLSGGQKQRVALGRALAPEPTLILFDEPFSNIDTLRKNQMRYDIEQIIRQSESTAIFVTHDTKDVLAIADSVVVLRQGISLQKGKPDAVYLNPRNQYVAEFFGKTNLLKGNLQRAGFATNIGMIPLLSQPDTAQGEVVLSIRPEQLEICTRESACFCGSIIHESFFGEYKELILKVPQTEGGTAEITVYAPASTVIRDGVCHLRIKVGQQPKILEE